MIWPWGESDLKADPFASLGDIPHLYPTSSVGIVPFSPVKSTKLDPNRTMRALALTLALVAVVPFVTIRQTAQALGLLNPATTTTTTR
jgi:hypothetical protein